MRKFLIGAAALGLLAAGFAVFWFLSQKGEWRQDAASPRFFSGASKNVPLESAPAASAKSASSYTTSQLQKVRVLEEIFRSRNDNDPRLDSDFKNLDPGTKELLQAEYRKLAAEKRNERGTIVFLLGRNLTTEQDFAFLNEVFAEAPCKSLGDCAKDAPLSRTGSEHDDTGTEITLAYPQIVAVEMLKNFSKDHPGSPLSTAAAHALEEATRSANPVVADRARKAAALIRS
jgi:hypothetical protein